MRGGVPCEFARCRWSSSWPQYKEQSSFIWRTEFVTFIHRCTSSWSYTYLHTHLGDTQQCHLHTSTCERAQVIWYIFTHTSKVVRGEVPCLHVCERERGRLIHIYTHIWSGTRRKTLPTCVCVRARVTGYISTHTSKVIQGGVPRLHVCVREHRWSYTYLHTQLKW